MVTFNPWKDYCKFIFQKTKIITKSHIIIENKILSSIKYHKAIEQVYILLGSYALLGMLTR